jgi:hypothetical protein
VRARPVLLTLVLVGSALLSGCTQAETSGAAPTSSDRASESASPTTATGSPTGESTVAGTPAAWPAEVPYPVEGPAWVVYIAVAQDGSQAERDRVSAALEQLRGTTPYVSARGAGSIGCEIGAAETLGLDQATFAAPVFLASEAEAQQFAQLWGAGVVGPARITENCIA